MTLRNAAKSASSHVMKVWIAVLSVVLALLIAGFCVYWFLYTASFCCGANHVAANHNDVASVQAEIDSEDFRQFLARAAHISQWRVRHYKAEIHESGFSGSITRGVNQQLSHALSVYVSCRAEGHSVAYSRKAVELVGAPLDGQPGFIKAIREEYHQSILPQWIHHTAETAPDADGDHTTTVVMLDGELAWQYDVGYGNDESVRYVMRERIDAVELTPAYLGVIAEIEEQVAARMKAEGIKGFGSCHAFWHIKQELLKGKGIIWHTPTEMNPGTCYD
jgi:hypothetical protein